MTNTRQMNLFNGALEWVWEHCPDEDAYVRALDTIGFTLREIYDDLTMGVGMSRKEALDTIRCIEEDLDEDEVAGGKVEYFEVPV